MSHFLKRLTLTNLLSFGPESADIPLMPLNVIIGPNGSGKSNLIEAIGLLRACAIESALNQTISAGGGITGWLWKGESKREAGIEAILDLGRPMPLRHRIVLGSKAERTIIVDEAIEDEKPSPRRDAPMRDTPLLYYRFNRGTPVITIERKKATGGGRMIEVARQLRPDELRPNESILVQRREPHHYPELAALTDKYSGIQVFRGWETTRFSAIRASQPTDKPPDRLEPDGLNLGIVLNNIKRSAMQDEIHQRLTRFDEKYEDIDVRVFGGRAQMYLHERNVGPVSAYQLPDGLLRYLCILAVLCNPVPATLVCIEEPELGLHPNVILEIADLLIEASQRMQIVVTTHSEILVDRFTTSPESVLVCEKPGATTQVTRLDSDELKEWLKKYRLGQL